MNMLEGESSSFTDLDQVDLDFMRNSVALSSFDITNSVLDDNGIMDPMLLGPNDETTLSMEDYQYINENNLLVYQYPPEDPKELCNTDYAGPFNFEVFVDPNVLKNPWEYSSILNKIYIDMKHKFPINFSIKNKVDKLNLFIRIMPMFEEDRYSQDLVHRCLCHSQLAESSNNGISELTAQHIIRCDNKNAMYCGNKNNNTRLSIIVPLGTPEAGTDSVKEYFHFVCKNSCVGGMNRRPIQVIFTLEDESGTVHGRRVLCVRICSCPKRDREKEEKKKNESHSSSKKRKMEKKVLPTSPNETIDTTVYNANFNIVGRENFKLVLKYAQALMGDGANQCKLLQNIALFKKHRDDVSGLLTHLNE